MSDTRHEHGSLQPPPQPPRMNRSQPQLATVYAPGAMFTWEGGKGACIAAPVEGAPTIDFSNNSTRRDQIFETMTEYCESWLQRGLNINRPVPVYGVQLLDGCFYSESRTGVPSVSIASDRFDFFRPDRIGYVPGPLVYRCDHCEIVREYTSPAHQMADPLPTACRAQEGGECRWRQLDVIYAHWSGGLEGLSPYRYSLAADGQLRKIPRCQCGNETFRLIKQGNQFSRWRFKCTGCQGERELYQNDPFTLGLLKPRIEAGTAHTKAEIHMNPVSYRASPVFYVQAARFIVYDNDAEIVTILGPNRQPELTAKLAALHGFGGADPTPDQIRAQLAAKGRDAMYPVYERVLRQAADAVASRNAGTALSLGDMARDMLQGWYDVGDVVPESQASPALRQQVIDRHDRQYARRFDPMRSTIEHDALRRRKLEPTGQSANLRHAHADLAREFGDPEREASYERCVAAELARAGIEDARLIRDLDMVEFSFGYTRVAATPETVQKDRPMPVRLMGFPRLQNNKRPIYVIEQQNEALYFRLDTAAVGAFLRRNGVLRRCRLRPRRSAVS